MTNSEISRSFPHQVSALRIRMGWTREQLAAAMRMSRDDLLAFETGAVELGPDSLIYLLNSIPAGEAEAFLSAYT